MGVIILEGLPVQEAVAWFVGSSKDASIQFFTMSRFENPKQVFKILRSSNGIIEENEYFLL